MYEMPLVAEFEARPRLAPYASELAEYLRGISSPDSSQKLQERFLAFIRWAEQLESENDLEVLSLPVDPTYAIIYALDLDRRGLALTTLSNYMSAVGDRSQGSWIPCTHAPSDGQEVPSLPAHQTCQQGPPEGCRTV